MSELTEAKCEACHTGAPKVTDEEMAELMGLIPDWSIQNRNHILQLEKEYTFRNFKMALDFANAVGAIAEEEGHHPALLTEWGKVTVTWWTHKIKGLHRNDFIMAAKTDNLVSG